VSAFPEQPVALSPAQDEFEDLEDLEAPDNHVFARREIDRGAADDESYESMVEELEVEAEEPVAPARPHQPPDLIVFPPIAEVAPPSPQNPPPPRPPSSAFPAPAPIAAEPPRSAEPPLELDPTSILQVVSVDAPRASDFAIGMGSDDIGPGRFSSRTAPVAALAAELDHMDIPPIDRVALKRFLIDLALRLESDTCAWVDLRAAIITVMEYPQLARRALPALLPFLDRAA